MTGVDPWPLPVFTDDRIAKIMTAQRENRSIGNTDLPRNSRLSGRIYLVRVVFTLLTLLLLAVDGAFCHPQSSAHPYLSIAGLVYPHLGHWMLGRFDPDVKLGRTLFLIDGLYAGAVIGALGFAWLPSLILLVIYLFNLMIIGGALLIGLGLALLFAGALLSGNLAGAASAAIPEVCHALLWPTSGLFTVYFLLVAYVIRRLIGALQHQQAMLQAQTDAALTARRQAERALLSALPRSVASQLEATGKHLPETLQTADLLLIELSPVVAPCPDLTPLQVAWQTCETILTRHGLELIKTCGSRAVAVGRSASGTEALLTAGQEILTHFSDHSSPSHPCSYGPARLIIHQGVVTLGLVQPTRLNADLFGPGVEELLTLSIQAARLEIHGLILSPAAFRQLQDQTGWVPCGGDTDAPLCYLARNVAEP